MAMGPMIQLWEADVATLNSIAVTFAFVMDYTKTTVNGGDTYVYTTSLSGSISGTATVTPVDFSTTTAPAGSNTFALIRNSPPPFLTQQLSQAPNIRTRIVQDLLDGTYNTDPAIYCTEADFVQTITQTLNGGTPTVDYADISIGAGVLLSTGAVSTWDVVASTDSGSPVFVGSVSGTFFEFTSTLPDSGNGSSFNISTLAGFSGTTVTQTYAQPNDTATVTWSGWNVEYQWDITTS